MPQFNAIPHNNIIFIQITRSSSKTLFLSVFKFVRKFAIFHSIMLFMSALCVQIIIFTLLFCISFNFTHCIVQCFFKITNLSITYLHSESIIVFISILFVFFVQLLFRIICANIYFTAILCKNRLAGCIAHHHI